MKTSKVYKAFFQHPKGRILKYSTLGLATIAIFLKIKFYVTRDTAFQKKMRLVFPDYD